MKRLLEQPQPQKKSINKNSNINTLNRKTRVNTKDYRSLIDQITQDSKSNSIINLDPNFERSNFLRDAGYFIKDKFWDTPNEWIRKFFMWGLTYEDEIQKYRQKSETDWLEDLAIFAQAVPFIATVGFDETINFVKETIDYTEKKNRELTEKIDQFDAFLKKKAAGNSVAEFLTGKGYAKNTNRMVLLQDIDGTLDQIIGIVNEITETRAAYEIFDPEKRDLYYDKDGKLNKYGEEGLEKYNDWYLTKKTGLDKTTIDFNKKIFMRKFLKLSEQQDIDDFEEDKDLKINNENVKKKLDNTFKKNPDILNRLKKYENTEASEIIENPNKISEIITTTQDAIATLQKNIDNENVVVTPEEINKISKVFNVLNEFKNKVPNIDKEFKKINEKSKNDLIAYYQRYGIFNLSQKNSSNSSLLEMYNEFNKLSKENAEKILSKPFSSSNDPELNQNLLKKKILQFSIYTKILDNALYQINNFTDLLLSSKIINKKENNAGDMETNNLLNVVMELMKKELNDKNGNNNSVKINITNMSDILTPVTKLQTFKFDNVDSGINFNSAYNFYADKMLNVNDKIVGLFSQKSIVNKITNNKVILPKVYEKISQLPGFSDSTKDSLKQAFLNKFRKIPFITSLILLSNHGVEKNTNPVEKRYYYLYQLDISKFYDVLFDDDNFFEYFLNIKFDNENDDMTKSNLDKIEGEFSIIEPEPKEIGKKTMTVSKNMILSVFDIREYIQTNDEMVQYIEPLELDELNNEDNKNNKDNKNNVMGNLNFSYETFSFENKKISDKKNSKNLSDLFVQAGLSDLVTNKNIFN